MRKDVLIIGLVLLIFITSGCTSSKTKSTSKTQTTQIKHPVFYPERPEGIQVKEELSLVDTLRRGESLKIKGKIEYIGPEKIYGLPVISLSNREEGFESMQSLSDWYINKQGEVIKERRQSNEERRIISEEYRWINPGDEFFFDIVWKWEDPGIQPGKHHVQVSLSLPRDEIGRRYALFTDSSAYASVQFIDYID